MVWSPSRSSRPREQTGKIGCLVIQGSRRTPNSPKGLRFSSACRARGGLRLHPARRNAGTRVSLRQAGSKNLTTGGIPEDRGQEISRVAPPLMWSLDVRPFADPAVPSAHPGAGRAIRRSASRIPCHPRRSYRWFRVDIRGTAGVVERGTEPGRPCRRASTVRTFPMWTAVACPRRVSHLVGRSRL